MPAITHNSSPASWSLSVSPFAVVNEPSESVSARAASNLERTPPRSERAERAVTRQKQGRWGQKARRRLFAAVAAGSVIVGVTGALWLGRDRAGDRSELASSTVDGVSSLSASHALSGAIAGAPAITPPSPAARAEAPDPAETKPDPQLNVRAATPEKAPPRIKAGAAKSAPAASVAPTASAPSTRRAAPPPPADEDLILNLPQ